MTDQTERPAPEKGSGDTDVHAEGLKRYERGYNAAQDNIDRAYKDLAFLAGDGQWDDKIKQNRDDEDRPCLTVDKVSQFVRQVTGDLRQMRPAIKVTAVDDRGSAEVAEKILPGMIRYIEQRSDAQAAYFNAADSQAAAGIGHWRVMTEYAATDTFLQELRIAPIDDGVSVIWDPDAALPTREDAQWCFVPVDISADAFKERWPDASADAIDHPSACISGWSAGDTIRVAEYWAKEPAKRRLALLPSGGVDDVTDDEAAEADALALGARIEERDDHKVVRYLISASEVLEGPDEWPGRHIPIVPLLGEEIKIGNKVVRRGVIRALRDPQRLYNYSVSQQAELIALQPKAPFIGTKKNFEQHIDQWETANSRNWPFLEYTPDPANGNAPPARSQPPVASQGLTELLQVATADMSAVTGIYPASLGQSSNESSGKAILARQREGDTGTYVYTDNFARALRHTGRILLDLIPHIYDTERSIQIVGEDGKVDLMRINAERFDPNGDGIATQVLNDVTVGAYSIAIEMGPSYSSKKAEARDGMQAFMQAAGPQVAQLYIDLFAKMQDWPLADQISKRANLMLPPVIRQVEAAESGEQPPQLPPNPAQQAQAQQAQLQHQIEQAKLQLEAAKIKNDADKIAAEREKAQLEAQMEAVRMRHEVQQSQVMAQQQPALDPRVDQLAQAVAEISGLVQQIIAAMQQPPPMPMNGGGGGMPPPQPPVAAPAAPDQPPPGGFFMPGEGEPQS